MTVQERLTRLVTDLPRRTPVAQDEGDAREYVRPPAPVGLDLGAGVAEDAHPGAATFRGAVVLPDGTPVAVRPGVEPPLTLRATGRTRRVRHLPGRTPVYAGYAGGPIPTTLHGTVRVGVNWRAVFLVLTPWAACAVAAGWGAVAQRVGVCWAALVMAFLVGVAAPSVAAPRGLQVPQRPAQRPGLRAGGAR